MMGKYFIEFELPDNDVVLNEAEHSYVSWRIWGFSGRTFPRKFVRCKDCQYADFKCPYPICNLLEMNITEQSFCSWAKMKGGAE